jgi:hypothetical protein
MSRGYKPRLLRKEGKPTMTDFKYDVPILSLEHAKFCLAEAERRYGGKIVRDREMLIVVDADGNALATDAVLRALSFMVLGDIPQAEPAEDDGEDDEPPVKNIMQAIIDAMVDDDDAYRQSYKFIAWYEHSTDEQKEIIDRTLIQICGWSFATLLEKSEDWA